MQVFECSFNLIEVKRYSRTSRDQIIISNLKMNFPISRIKFKFTLLTFNMQRGFNRSLSTPQNDLLRKKIQRELKTFMKMVIYLSCQITALG